MTASVRGKEPHCSSYSLTYCVSLFCSEGATPQQAKKKLRGVNEIITSKHTPGCQAEAACMCCGTHLKPSCASLYSMRLLTAVVWVRSRFFWASERFQQ